MIEAQDMKAEKEIAPAGVAAGVTIAPVDSGRH
jgi:hypothetical protein